MCTLSRLIGPCILVKELNTKDDYVLHKKILYIGYSTNRPKSWEMKMPIKTKAGNILKNQKASL